MSDVTWFPHPVFDIYEISRDGRVRSIERYTPNPHGTRTLRRQREISRCKNARGYLQVGIYHDGVKRPIGVHVLACTTFHGEKPSPDSQVRHLNGDKLDNRAENLAWGTSLENIRDIRTHGRNHNLNKTQCIHGHEFTPENTYVAIVDGRPKRNCSQCNRDRRRARDAKKRSRAA